MVPTGHEVSGRLDPRRPGRPFSCASCHNPHGSDNPLLFYLGANPLESCDGCHGNRSGKNPGAKNIISRAVSPPASESGAGGSGGAGGGGADAPGGRPPTAGTGSPSAPSGGPADAPRP
jgi:predicted CXXCH cytochrome family protein